MNQNYITKEEFVEVSDFIMMMIENREIAIEKIDIVSNKENLLLREKNFGIEIVFLYHLLNENPMLKIPKNDYFDLIKLYKKEDEYEK
jgi:hypothetical protein